MFNYNFRQMTLWAQGFWNVSSAVFPLRIFLVLSKTVICGINNGFNILLLIIVSANQYELLKPKVSSLFGYDTQFVEASRSGMISINQFQLNPCHDIWRGTLWRELLMLPPHIDLGVVVFTEIESHPGSELNSADFRKLALKIWERILRYFCNISSWSRPKHHI